MVAIRWKMQLRASPGATGRPREPRLDEPAGWVSALLSLKAALGHGVDLRTHGPRRTWSAGSVDI